MTSDGEGFGLAVALVDSPWDHPAWETMPLPYSDPSAHGKPDPAWQIEMIRYALRQANAALVKRGVKPVPDPTRASEEAR